MAKELQPVVLRLKTWRAQNDISQAEAAELLRRRGLPIRLRTLQAWEAGRSAPNPFAAVAITEFLDKHRTVWLNSNKGTKSDVGICPTSSSPTD
jgi:DNA-binding transcriptional regulator YiaG